MKKILLYILFSILVLPISATEVKRDSIINAIINFEIGRVPTLKKEMSTFKDSINDFPMDSIRLRQAVIQCNGVQDFIKNMASLVCLFPQGTTSFDYKNLPTYKLDNYQLYATGMKKWLSQYRKLVEQVDNYVPYQYRRVTEKYSTLNGNGETKKYVAVYYFNNNDDLERYFWFDEEKWNMATGMINYAVNHDYTFIEKLIAILGFQFNESLMTYLMGGEEVQFNREELNKLIKSREEQAKRESSSNGFQNSTSNKVHTSKNSSNPRNQQANTQRLNTPRTVKMHGPKYMVIKDVCGATYTKEAMKKFTKYAINNNTSGIDYMIVSGQLTVLSRGQEVTMLDLGFITSQVQLSNGAIVYVDTECLRKK